MKINKYLIELNYGGLTRLYIKYGEFYVLSDKGDYYKKCSKEVFIHELNKLAYDCLKNDNTRQDYLNIVDYVKDMK